ncbi:PfkB family carbohydrate kinase [Halorarius litoreus]|uniref:PfkB family carbohydrate kinase n=1 Tax=Halorarius litoreus TaxID=2962676 RepID=UPI0020CD7BC9|nr:PfkB family carbohydrate kinase [Halorarius litoreus]
MLITFGATALRLSPPAGDRLETAGQFDAHATGPESDAAVAARRTGIETAHATVLPDSPLGRRVANELRAHDLDVRVTWTEGRQGLAFYEHGAGVREPVWLDDRTSAAFDDIEMGALPLDAVREADCVYFTGATPGYSTPAAEAAARFVRAAREGDGLTAFGLEYRAEQWSPEDAKETLSGYFPAVDVFVARERDVETVLGRDGQPSQVAHALAHEHGFETVVLVRDRTTVAWHDSTLYEFSVVDSDAVDPTGAVAACTGAFLARLLDGADTETALRYGTAAHALARTVDGPLATFSRSELDRAAEAIEGR